jgi:putative photosynthetic complex assembly protein 2
MMAMCPYAAPLLATVALWWSSTGLVLMLDSQDRRTYLASMAGASGLLVGALFLIATTASETTPLSAYAAFTCGIVVWAWQLLAFYTGFVTGPVKRPCRPSSSAFSRFTQAVAASAWHEIAALLGAAVILVLTRDQPNRVALWTYLVLWLMHSSAKLNLFLGVPNLGAEMLPDHLAYLTSFMRRRPMNDLFPASVTVGTLASALFFAEAVRSRGDGFAVASFAMLGSLMALAVVEHWFLVAPVDGNALWRAFRRRAPDAERATAMRVERALAEAPDGATAQVSAAGLWRADPPHVCDAHDIGRLLQAIAAGNFGTVDCVHGLVRTEAEWICFELNEGQAQIASLGPRKPTEPAVIAKGRGFDQARLKAAFDRCAAPA